MRILSRDDISKLLDNHWLLFITFYDLLIPEFNQVSTDIRNNPSAIQKFQKLSTEFFNLFRSFYPLAPHAIRQKIINNFRENPVEGTDYRIFCHALFKGLGEYLTSSTMGQLKRVSSVRVGDVIITPTPANPIYDGLPNPIRTEIGFPPSDFFPFLNKISVVHKMHPNIAVLKKSALHHSVDRHLKKKLKTGLKIAVASDFAVSNLDVNSHLSTWPQDQKTPYWFQKINSFDKVAGNLELLFKECVSEHINILVLPELTIDLPLLEWIQNWLSENNRDRVSNENNGLMMVAAGSFHFEDRKGHIQNIATILDHGGNILWQQSKCQPFSVDVNDVQKTPELKKILKISDQGGYEKIEGDGKFWCVDTAVGRICVCICIDFFHPDHAKVFQKSGANLFLVPAMSENNKRFQQTAWFLGGASLSSTFVALTGFLPLKKTLIDPKSYVSFYYVPDSKTSYSFHLDKTRLSLGYLVQQK